MGTRYFADEQPSTSNPNNDLIPANIVFDVFSNLAAQVPDFLNMTDEMEILKLRAFIFKQANDFFKANKTPEMKDTFSELSDLEEQNISIFKYNQER